MRAGPIGNISTIEEDEIESRDVAERIEDV